MVATSQYPNTLTAFTLEDENASLNNLFDLRCHCQRNEKMQSF